MEQRELNLSPLHFEPQLHINLACRLLSKQGASRLRIPARIGVKDFGPKLSQSQNGHLYNYLLQTLSISLINLWYSCLKPSVSEIKNNLCTIHLLSFKTYTIQIFCFLSPASTQKNASHSLKFCNFCSLCTANLLHKACP